MSGYSLDVHRGYRTWDGTFIVPHAIIAWYDPDWDSYCAQVLSDVLGDPPLVWIGPYGHDGAVTVDDLAVAIMPYATLTPRVVQQLANDRDATDPMARNEASACRALATTGLACPRVSIWNGVRWVPLVEVERNGLDATTVVQEDENSLTMSAGSACPAHFDASAPSRVIIATALRISTVATD